ncbi:MAG TPA: helix-turn-helix domain-containing protein [Rhodoblastus sp.]|nr:helix-turn-helix domain-containing protein [Rhodoblastus sp.]
MASTARARGSSRERILLTAHDLFYRDGVRATGVDRLIAEAGVTKVTFYRQFPSKDDLIRAYLAFRHDMWMSWFRDALERNCALQSRAERRAAPLAPVLAAAREWFLRPEFRGCAFINSVAELAGVLPDVSVIAANHKGEAARAIETLLSEGPPSARKARAALAALDGAIVAAQAGEAHVEAALQTLDFTLRALDGV